MPLLTKRTELVRVEIYEHVRDVDILITHTPPYELGGLDRIHNGTSVGCQELTRRLTAAHDHKDALHPKLHVFGHIHEARGTHVLCNEQGETVLVNAALVEYDQALWNKQRKCKYPQPPNLVPSRMCES